MEKKEQESFEVKDRRRFVADSSGEIKDSGPEAKSEGQKGTEPPRDEAQTTKAEKEPSPRQEQRSPLPDIDFPTFILSLSSSALLNLGLAENPATQKIEKNLPLAKQTIDIIVMLQKKTKGNLSQDESNLIDNLIADLRLRYVNEIKK